MCDLVKCKCGEQFAFRLCGETNTNAKRPPLLQMISSLLMRTLKLSLSLSGRPFHPHPQEAQRPLVPHVRPAY